jgi:hypothetical protein
VPIQPVTVGAEEHRSRAAFADDEVNGAGDPRKGGKTVTMPLASCSSGSTA